MKIKYYIPGLIAVFKIKSAMKKNVLPENSRKLYRAVKLAGMKDRIKP